MALKNQIARDILWQMIREGKQPKQVAQLFRVHPASVRNLAKQYGLSFNKSRPGPKPKAALDEKPTAAPAPKPIATPVPKPVAPPETNRIVVAAPPKKGATVTRIIQIPRTQSEIQALSIADLKNAVWEIRKQVRRLGSVEAAVLKEIDLRIQMLTAKEPNDEYKPYRKPAAQNATAAKSAATIDP